MVVQGALVLGIVLVVLLLILVGRAKPGPAGDDRDDARELIGKEIDAHLESLAQSWLEARLEAGMARPGTDRFGQEFELFIAAVLRRSVEGAQPWLRDALREIVVLERDGIRAEIERRIERHLRRPLAADPGSARASLRA